MSDAGTEHQVECPICGDPFDPTVAGGWCTNPDCGEWQYDGDVEASAGTADETDDEYQDLLSEAADKHQSPDRADEPDESADPLTGPDDSAADEAGEVADAERGPQTPLEKTDDDQSVGEATEESESVDDQSAGEADAEPSEAGDDDEPTAPEADEGRSEDSVEQTPSGDETTDEAAPSDATDSEAAAAIDCPDCGVDLDADANFCVECGADVRDVDGDESEPLTDCPSCDAPVDSGDSFCANCGEDLDAHRSEGANGAGEQAADDADDAVEALKAQSETEEDQEPVPESLVLEVRGREIDVEDGDHVGREIRAALTDAGRPEDEAVRVHREHVRFVRESDAFYLVDLGDNPTRLNGRSLQKGDREPVAAGDELELSGVATATIRVP